MTLQEKLQCLLMAADSLRQSAMLPETVRSALYELSQQINKVNVDIIKITKEIAEAPIQELNKSDDIPF